MNPDQKLERFGSFTPNAQRNCQAVYIALTDCIGNAKQIVCSGRSCSWVHIWSRW